jgi:8-oxo-dGTP diphosphatase
VGGGADLQFGEARQGLAYRDRPSAYGIAVQGGEVALVRVVLSDRAPFYDLPGGGVDEGETEAEGLVREFGEETGLVVRPGRLVARARQYMVSAHDEPFNSHGAFFETVVEAANAALKIEDSHTLVWRPAHAALTLLRHDSHAWAVAAWLRAREGRG